MDMLGSFMKRFIIPPGVTPCGPATVVEDSKICGVADAIRIGLDVGDVYVMYVGGSLDGASVVVCAALGCSTTKSRHESGPVLLPLTVWEQQFSLEFWNSTKNRRHQTSSVLDRSLQERHPRRVLVADNFPVTSLILCAAVSLKPVAAAGGLLDLAGCLPGRCDHQ